MNLGVEDKMVKIVKIKVNYNLINEFIYINCLIELLLIYEKKVKTKARPSLLKTDY